MRGAAEPVSGCSSPKESSRPTAERSKPAPQRPAVHVSASWFRSARPVMPKAEPQNDAIAFRGLHKSFGRGDERVKVLDGVDLTIRQGQFVTVIGPSGCGKTTLLRLAAGLVKPDA